MQEKRTLDGLRDTVEELRTTLHQFYNEWQHEVGYSEDGEPSPIYIDNNISMHDLGAALHHGSNVLESIIKNIKNNGLKITAKHLYFKPKFLTWCSKQKCRIICGSLLTEALVFEQINFSTIGQNVTFFGINVNVSFLFCNIHSKVTCFDFHNCRTAIFLKSDVFDELFEMCPSAIIVIRACEGLERVTKIGYTNTKEVSITFEDTPPTNFFNALRDCRLHNLKIEYEGDLPAQSLNSICRYVTTRELTLGCAIDQTFQPINFFFLGGNVDVKWTRTVKARQTNPLFVRAMSAVLMHIEDYGCGTSSLIACQEMLIEKGLSKYAKI